MEPTDEERKRLERARKGDFVYLKVHVKDLPQEMTELFEGELYYQPKFSIIGGLTVDDPPYLSPVRLDTSGRLDVVSSPYAIASGEIRLVSGTFTKGAAGALGTLVITPGADDVIYFLYGLITMGGTRVGGAEQLYAGISGSDASADLIQTHLDDSGANANEIFPFPGLGEVSTAPAATSGVYHTLQTMIVGANLMNSDGGATDVVAYPRYIIECDGMAQDEVLEASLYFLSITNTAVTVAAVEGVWA